MGCTEKANQEGLTRGREQAPVDTRQGGLER